MNNIVIIPFGEHAKLRIRKDKIVATVSSPGSNNTDIYIEGLTYPQHVCNFPADEIMKMVWGEED